MNRVFLAATACLFVAVVACGREGNGNESENSSVVDGTHHDYVVSKLFVPANSRQRQDFSLDLGSSGS